MKTLLRPILNPPSLALVICLVVVLSCFIAVSKAQATNTPFSSLLLVHGYASDPDAWHDSGILAILEKNNWHPGGTFLVEPNGRFHLKATSGTSAQRYYLIDLPSEAPIRYQGTILEAIVASLLQKQPKTLLFAAGHSAGGVALRLAMVERPDLGIRGLITIAAPHRGTDTARLASFITQTPLAMITPFAGLGTLNRSQGLYADLDPEQPGNFLFWLNHREHPRAYYLSIIRKPDGLFSVDPIVPSESQDLTQVQALGRRAERVTSGSGHALQANDGNLMADTLDRWIAQAGQSH
ncbi:MAG: alpha/beta fold hydrolase [Magnetococcales bacterium]|nr:alpha/beta fold hydrolase [Magnetococcales bacterium]